MTPYYQDNHVTIYHGDVLDCLAGMPEESVQCVVTSPPYWGLRDYGQDGQLGLERTPDEYVMKMVEVFREVRRVLRKDGILWLNLGDSYAQSEIRNRNGETPAFYRPCRDAVAQTGRKLKSNLKPKDLVGIPWRVALALQADGWWLRSDVIWSKPNPMPESVTDRPTRAHEYVFLLTKAARYFYDADAVREPLSGPLHGRGGDPNSEQYATSHTPGIVSRDSERPWGSHAGRNKRTVWEIATQPYKEAHFAVMPEKLVEPCILAGTSAKGACPECGSPWVRVVEKQEPPDYGRGTTPKNINRQRNALGPSGNGLGTKASKTLGFRPTCDHGTPPVPCVVLDPFLGAGTVATVAKRHNRRAVGCDLNAEYLDMAILRIQREGCQLSLTG